jgi:FkbM family methyltransferase
MTSGIRSVRNAAASAMAWTLYHAPVLEAPYAHAARAARTVPGLHTLFREATDRLADRLVRASRQCRRVRIGSASPLFDVSSFTVKGQYFAHVPYEPGATGAVQRYLEPGGVFIDVGANVGYFTILAAFAVGPEGRVIAFEPNPGVRRQLEHHVRLNGVGDRVTVAGVALADRDEDEVPFFTSCWPENDGISSLTPSAETIARGGLRPDATIAVRVQTLDSFLGSIAIPRIDLMKIDVEGAERQVLAGMAETFDRRRPARIICETMPDGEAAALLRARGYRMSVLDEIPGGIPNLLFEQGQG